MPKISPQNRKFFLKWLPFNFCDRHCERCVEFKNECAINREEVQYKMECLKDGKDPNDLGEVFIHVGNILARTMVMIKEKMEEEGIEMTEEDMDRYEREEKEKDRIIKKNPLYLETWNIMNSLRKFVDEFSVSVNYTDKMFINSIKREFEEIGFYLHPIFIKTARALHSKIDNLDERLKFSRPDYMVSGALAFYSLKTVKTSLNNIKEIMRGSQDVWEMRINTILKDIGDVEKIYMAEFSGVGRYKDKIIFHGKIK